MPITARYIFTASMDVDPDKEDLFNEVYDEEHVPMLLKVPGVLSVTRLKQAPLTLSIGGEEKAVDTSAEPTYSAVYEIESPDVLTSTEWADAIEQGRWPEQVRPYTSNRRHTVQKVMD